MQFVHHCLPPRLNTQAPDTCLCTLTCFSQVPEGCAANPDLSTYNDHVIRDEDWHIIREYTGLLWPISHVSYLLQGGKYVTISILYPCLGKSAFLNPQLALNTLLLIYAVVWLAHNKPNTPDMNGVGTLLDQLDDDEPIRLQDERADTELYTVPPELIDDDIKHARKMLRDEIIHRFYHTVEQPDLEDAIIATLLDIRYVARPALSPCTVTNLWCVAVCIEHIGGR